jgi:acetyl-CoA acetyltransferase
MTDATLRGKAAIIGIGESTYYRHGQSPDSDMALALTAVRAACADAGIDAADLDGFCSYSMQHVGPIRLAAALGLRELRFSVLQWEGGGAGMAAAVSNAAMAVATGQADYVVAMRSIVQSDGARYGQMGGGANEVSGERAFLAPYGIGPAGQMFAFKYMRWMHEHGGVGLDAQKAVSLASYHHAQQNPRAVRHGRPLTPEAYDESRMIVEPWRLFDYCQENDGAAALILTSPERARAAPHAPVYLLGAAQGVDGGYGRAVYNSRDYPTSGFTPVAPRLWDMAKVGPGDVDVVQSYENFTGAVVMSLVEHGFCAGEEVDEFLTFENLVAPSGKLPLNTSGGNLAEAYIHGFNLAIEGVRQLRGDSVNQVPGANVAMVNGGPLAAPVTNLVLGTEATL